MTLTILDAGGQVIRTLETPGAAGLHSVVWDLRYDPPAEPVEAGGGGRFRGGPPAAPLVLPGHHMVRLEAAGQTQEVPLEVRVDPRVEVTMAELEARHEAAMSLYALAGPLNTAQRRLGELSDQIDEARDLVQESDEAPEGLPTRVDSLRARVQEISTEFGRLGGTARLGRSLESIFAAPTADQLWQIERAWEEVPGLVERLNEVIARDLPALYGELNDLGIRPDPGEPLEVPRRPGGGGGPPGTHP